ncbi:murein DD-endopeptidase MepM/ murein hydrolase activator NlpD [Paenibacillus sp. SORGH_AS306]|uniref:M23 family metallopeptidase n=1 Tax=unclassified Paenibacillus TaxID=185978 RepID=UPI0027857B64|nr:MULTISPECIES: M23 family metallopeptidase [unclassified Paenibacillus]MDQ1236511.1 murein DD-endopeptidase MepM/ murein hydrolase activator NlpD [Paenibacillus sp. SORGH_AS_0306]MDR6108866.1 murein DD-endopeptidase MepM/ murein hydrolase activator NlpD [Paenibacillus sp. SORGH_AS_0338]
MKGFRSKLGMGNTSKQDQPRDPQLEVQNEQQSTDQSEAPSAWYTITVDSIRKGKNKMRRRLMIAAGGLVVVGGLIWAGNHYVTANTIPYYVVSVKGQAIGTILHKEELQQLFTTKRAAYQKKYPKATMVLNTNGITTTEERAYKAQVNSANTLKTLDGMLTAYAKSVEVNVDGKVIGIVKDQKVIDAALEQVKEKYTKKAESAKASTKTSTKAYPKQVTGLESVTLKQKVSTGEIKANPNKLLSSTQLAKVMTTGVESPTTYVVREGDTISSIASDHDITQEEIFANNPKIDEMAMQIGDELTLTVPQPPITVTTFEDYSEQIVTEPSVEIRKSDSMREGESKVVAQGSTGLKRIDYRVTKQNGQMLREEWLGQEVTKKSSPKVIIKGTKVVQGEGSGNLIWPVSGASVTSPFGQRWGKTHKGIDLVGSSSVMAADDGVVSYAGTMTGYGNVIIINHNNGYETLYGHLSQIDTSTGAIVEQGQHIGVMGNTGHSTGTHLHFEVHSGGAIQNPLGYLP